MRTLRWMCGVTKLGSIKNERGGTTKVGENSKKTPERGLIEHGHVERTEKDRARTRLEWR